MTDQPTATLGVEAFTDEHRERLSLRARAGRPLTPDDVVAILGRVELTPDLLAEIRRYFVVEAATKKDLEVMINSCITGALKGKALEVKSTDMQSLVLYIKSFAADKKPSAVKKAPIGC